MNNTAYCEHCGKFELIDVFSCHATNEGANKPRKEYVQTDFICINCNSYLLTMRTELPNETT